VEQVKRRTRKLEMVVVAISFSILTGCAATFISASDLVASKKKGEGKTRVYEVSVEEAWDISKRILKWEAGTDEIDEHRSEGYMVTKVGSTLLYKVTFIGVWIEPVDKVQSKVTVVTKSTIDTIMGLNEAEFHERFALFAHGPENTPP